jgi:ornithine cyclodeaminase
VELDLLDVMDKVVVDDWREAQSGRFGRCAATESTRPRHCTPSWARSSPASDPAGSATTADPACTASSPSLDIAVGLAILRRAEARRRNDARYR